MTTNKIQNNDLEIIDLIIKYFSISILFIIFYLIIFLLSSIKLGQVLTYLCYIKWIYINIFYNFISLKLICNK